MLNVLSMKTFCHIVIQHDFPTYVYIAMLYMLMYLSYQLPNALIAIHYRDSADSQMLYFPLQGVGSECPVDLFHCMTFSNSWIHLWLSQWAGCATNY